MVLHEIGIDKFFDKELLDFIWELKDDEARRMLEAYRPTEASLTFPHLKDTSQMTLLHIAAKYGNEVIAKYLIDSGSEVDARDSFGRTPLTLAFTTMRADKVIPVLLEANADLQLTDRKTKTALKELLMTKSTDPSMQKFFKEMSPQKIVKIGFLKYVRYVKWSFSQVASMDNVELMKLLLDQGRYAIDSMNTTNGKTALHIAVQRKNLDMVKMLIERGANANALDSSMKTPVRYLCHNREYPDREDGKAEYLEILKILLSHEISLTTCCSAGRMQIYNALVYGCREAVELILQRVDDLSVADDKNGDTVVHYLIENRNEDVIEVLNRREFNVNVRNRLGQTPLHCIANIACSPWVVEFLLENGANVHARDSHDHTPLRVMIMSNRPCLLIMSCITHSVRKDIKVLIEYGSSPLDSQVEMAFDKYSEAYDFAVRENFKRKEEMLEMMEPIIERLAVDEALGVEITEVVRSSIQKQSYWVEYLAMCRRHVDRMSRTKIYGDVALLKFLTENQTRITGYARNEELVSGFEKAIGEVDADSPYADLLRNRLERATRLSELREKAIAVVCQLIKFENYAHYFAAGHIIDYLRKKDMENLICVV